MYYNREKLFSTVAKELDNYGDIGHDTLHLERVEKLANLIFSKTWPLLHDQESKDLITLFSWIHEIEDSKFIDKSNVTVASLLEEISLEPKEMRNEIISLMKNISFSSSIEDRSLIIKETNLKKDLQDCNLITKAFYSVSDADRLETLGTIGIMRVFCFCGSQKRPFFFSNKECKPRLNLTFHQYLSDKCGTGLDHIFEKLLFIPNYVYTDYGRIEAKERLKTIIFFLKKLKEEVGIQYPEEFSSFFD